eukprot:767895-Hanusia_phi.AAC.13
MERRLWLCSATVRRAPYSYLGIEASFSAVSTAPGSCSQLKFSRSKEQTESTSRTISISAREARACCWELRGWWAGKEEKYRLLGDLGNQSSLVNDDAF